MMCSEMAKSLFEILINKIEVNAMYNGQYEYEGYQNISYEKWICLYKSSVK